VWGGILVANIEIQIDEPFVSQISEADMADAVARALAREEHPSAEVTVVMTDDETVAELNLRYRGVEGATDVLSFSAMEPAPGFVAAPEALSYLGDIVIAVPYSQRQAQELGRSLRDELRLLIVHGVLHLLGYDHATPDDEARMWARQDEILAGLARGE
jgi:probable rRNA maturation factor